MRRVTRAQAALLDSTRAGPIPGTDAVPPVDQRPWGLELGRRFRDQIRANEHDGNRIDAWQFDEVISQVVGDVRARSFVGGILRGLAQGRRKLQDRPPARPRLDGGVGRLGPARPRRRRRRAALLERLRPRRAPPRRRGVPVLQGDAEDVGRGQASGHRAFLASAGDVRRSLGKR
jgi:hypothetical protein